MPKWWKTWSEARAKPDTAVKPRVMDTAPIPMAWMDHQGHIHHCNTALHHLVQKLQLPHTLEGQNLFGVIDPANHEEVQALFDQTGDAKHTNLPIQVLLQGEGEEELHASLYLQHLPSKFSKGQDTWLAYLIDTTEQKSLELKVAHSQKMQAVGQLAGGIAHDFNNLLTAMIGFCDLLLQRHAPGEQSFADIMQIKQNANRAANLVRQLLAFSRRQTLQPKIVDITDVLAELSHLIRRLIGEQITLDVQHGRGLWPIKVDQGQLEQVVINLCVNARDAILAKQKQTSASRGGAITIGTRNCVVSAEQPLEAHLLQSVQSMPPKPGEYVRIDVQDDGCGMNAATLQKIFEPFFSTKDVGEGTGLGLATVYGIVEQTGGAICVHSKEGEGAHFVLLFKRHITTDDPVEEPADAEEEATPSDLTGQGTLLLVEDEAPVRMFSKRALENKGYTVLEAESGEEALQTLSEHEGDIDLIISDVMMPGMNGPEMVKEALHTYPEIRVIFISGYGEDSFRESFGQGRDFDFLPKPYSLSQLVAKVKEVLQ